MKLRAPATPLITIDPYFSVWSVNDALNEGETVHWTLKPNALIGTLILGDKEYLFMGNKKNVTKMVQTECTINAMSTIYKFAVDALTLTLTFTSPLLLNDLKVLARPVSYMKAELHTTESTPCQARISLLVADDICLDTRKECPTIGEIITIDDKSACGRMGSSLQPVLGKAGDDVRINWGYFYLSARNGAPEVHIHKQGEYTWLEAKVTLDTAGQNSSLFTFAYDDIYCLQYFGDNLKGYWVKESEDIQDIIRYAYEEYEDIIKSCNSFSDKLYQSALKSGGEKYAELLLLAYRQAIAAHKLCEDKAGKLLFISKECFSNACAATVDVTYPSIPLFLLYNAELVKGMLRPILKYAATEIWYHDFAPHDVGTYPLVNGQVYGGGIKLKDQMPIEECGNMLITMAAVCLASGDFSFAAEHLPVLKRWTEYLIKKGADPENQLCTDDFAGHLAHNCNLSAKAIMGVASFGILLSHLTCKEEGVVYFDTAHSMAVSWAERARNEDNTFKLTFDQAGTFSMKYNLIWDKLFQTEIFSKDLLDAELNGYSRQINEYGMPLDNRATYTKSDWLVWSAALMKNKEDFMTMIEPLWKAYHESESRVPMTDWYDTITAKQVGFQHRSVQGGLFIKLLLDKVTE